MKTLQKIVRAEQMQKDGYGSGDFNLKFIGYFCTNFTEKNARREDVVYAEFELYGIEGEYKTKPECTVSYKLFSFGFVTPKGYKSSKVIPVKVEDLNSLTKQEVTKLSEYRADYKINTFDAFYAENEAKRRNAAAWNYIAANYITDPYCTR
jgi:hypothetical protein